MIFVRIETHSRARKPKPRYAKAPTWQHLLTQLERVAPGAGTASEDQWHTLKIRTISEAEYVRHTSTRR